MGSYDNPYCERVSPVLIARLNTEEDKMGQELERATRRVDQILKEKKESADGEER